MRMLTPYNVAELMQVSYDTALAFIKTSGIAYIRVGRQYRVTEKAFEAFVSAGQTKNVKSNEKNIYHNRKETVPIKLRRRQEWHQEM